MNSNNDFGMYFCYYNDEAVDGNEELSMLFYNKETGEISDALVDLGDIEDRTGPFYNATQPRDILLDRALLWDELTYEPIFTGSRRIQDAVWWNETLYVAITVSKTVRVNETQIFWAAIDAPSDIEKLLPSIPDVTASGFVTGDAIAENTSTFYPSIAVNRQGKVVIGFSAAGENIYMGSYAQEVDLPTERAVTIMPGEATFESLNGIPYAGDYSGFELDPMENNCFWSFNTYAIRCDEIDAFDTLHTWERGALATRWGKVCLNRND
jgi:hypothetical protein